MATVTFGAFADPHYADRNPRIGRWYRDACNRIAAAQAVFAAEETDFNVCLGDLIDLCEDERDLTSALAEVTALFASAGRPTYCVAGNHDLAALPRQTLAKELGWPGGKSYYSFVVKGIRFIVLDTNYTGDSETLPPWDKTWVNGAQLRWLAAELSQPEQAVILTHANLDPRKHGDSFDSHIVLNAAAVRQILEDSGKVRLVVQGHCHNGAKSVVNGITYVTLPAMVMGESSNSAMLFSLGDDGSFAYRQLFSPANQA